MKLYECVKTKLNESWYHFIYSDGSNPYIAKSEAERDRLLKKYKDKVEQINDNTYKVIIEKTPDTFGEVVEEADVSRTMDGNIYEVRTWPVQDFIADGKYSYADKIKFLAEELQESGNVDAYADERWNGVLLKIADILFKASNDIDSVEHDFRNDLGEVHEAEGSDGYESDEAKELEFLEKQGFSASLDIKSKKDPSIEGAATVKNKNEVYIYTGTSDGYDDFAYVSDGQAYAVDRLVRNWSIKMAEGELQESETIGNLLEEIENATTIGEIESIGRRFKKEMDRKTVEDEVNAIEEEYGDVYSMDEDSEEYANILDELKSCISSDFSGEEGMLNESTNFYNVEEPDCYLTLDNLKTVKNSAGKVLDVNTHGLVQNGDTVYVVTSDSDLDTVKVYSVDYGFPYVFKTKKGEMNESQVSLTEDEKSYVEYLKSNNITNLSKYDQDVIKKDDLVTRYMNDPEDDTLLDQILQLNTQTNNIDLDKEENFNKYLRSVKAEDIKDAETIEESADYVYEVVITEKIGPSMYSSKVVGTYDDAEQAYDVAGEYRARGIGATVRPIEKAEEKE